MKIQESGENYLETILLLQQAKGSVFSVDVAHEMGFSKPSVSRAVSILKKAELIEIEADGRIRFTAEGKARAERTYERHRVLTAYLMTLGVGRETAETDACKMEHDLSDETFAAMKARVEKI